MFALNTLSSEPDSRSTWACDSRARLQGNKEFHTRSSSGHIWPKNSVFRTQLRDRAPNFELPFHVKVIWTTVKLSYRQTPPGRCRCLFGDESESGSKLSRDSTKKNRNVFLNGSRMTLQPTVHPTAEGTTSKFDELRVCFFCGHGARLEATQEGIINKVFLIRSHSDSNLLNYRVPLSTKYQRPRDQRHTSGYTGLRLSKKDYRKILGAGFTHVFDQNSPFLTDLAITTPGNALSCFQTEIPGRIGGQ